MALLLLNFSQLNAQTVNVTGTWVDTADGDYELSTEVNGRPSYFHDPLGEFSYSIYWTGTRWVLQELPEGIIGMFNLLDTPNPPATSLSPWTPDACDPPGIFSGDGTTTTLSVEGFELNLIKIYPIPSSEFIQINGLTKTENYNIYNVLGAKINSGIISDNEKIDIKNLNNGLYYLKFTSGIAIKFIKE